MLSPLLFIVVMEALSYEFRIGCPWELLYISDLAIVAESLDELNMRLKNWKERLKVKGLKVTLGRQRSCAVDTMLPIQRSHLSSSYVEYTGNVLEQIKSSV